MSRPGVGVMAEVSVVSASRSTPVAPPRRKRAACTSQSSSESLGDSVCGINRTVRPVPSTKPQRPSVPPRVNVRNHKPDSKQPISARPSLTNGSPTKPTPISVPRALAGSNGGAVRQARSKPVTPVKEQQQEREPMEKKNSSSSPVKGRDAVKSYKPRQPVSGQISSRPSAVSDYSKHSPHKSVKQGDTTNTRKTSTSSPKRAASARKHSPTKPKPPPRPSVIPAVRGTSAANHSPPPSRPPNLPTSTAASTSPNSWTSKTAPYSHLFGSTQSLQEPGSSALRQSSRLTAPVGDRRLRNSSESLGHNDGLLAYKSLQSHRTMPRSVSHHNIASHTSTASHPAALSATRKSGTLKARPRQTERKSNYKVVSAPIKTSGNVSPTKKSTTTSPTRKLTSISKVPPKRPANPPSIKKVGISKPTSLTLTKALPAGSNTTNQCATSKGTGQMQQTIAQRTYDEHIYMDPKIGYSTSEGTEGNTEHGADYPYVIMTPCNESEHMYMPLAVDTTDELEDYDMVEAMKNLDQHSHQDEDGIDYYNTTELTHTEQQHEALTEDKEISLDDTNVGLSATTDKTTSEPQPQPDQEPPSDDLYINVEHLRDRGNHLGEQVGSNEDTQSMVESQEADDDHLVQPLGVKKEDKEKEEEVEEKEGKDTEDSVEDEKVKDGHTQGDQLDRTFDGEGEQEERLKDWPQAADDNNKSTQAEQQEGRFSRDDRLDESLEGEGVLEDGAIAQQLEGDKDSRDVQLQLCRPSELDHGSREESSESVQQLATEDEGLRDKGSHFVLPEEYDGIETNYAGLAESKDLEKSSSQDIDDKFEDDKEILENRKEHLTQQTCDDYDRLVQFVGVESGVNHQPAKPPYSEGVQRAYDVEREGAELTEQEQVAVRGGSEEAERPRENGHIADTKDDQFGTTKRETGCEEETRTSAIELSAEELRTANGGKEQQEIVVDSHFKTNSEC